jgi:non-heme chloroperoxidase
LVAHGDDDQVVPIGGSAVLSATLVPKAQFKIYLGGPHGLAQTRHAEFNTDLLTFIRS